MAGLGLLPPCFKWGCARGEKRRPPDRHKVSLPRPMCPAVPPGHLCGADTALSPCFLSFPLSPNGHHGPWAALVTVLPDDAHTFPTGKPVFTETPAQVGLGPPLPPLPPFPWPWSRAAVFAVRVLRGRGLRQGPGRAESSTDRPPPLPTVPAKEKAGDPRPAAPAWGSPGETHPVQPQTPARKDTSSSLVHPFEEKSAAPSP